MTLYLHGLCCDIDVETGPRQLPSRHLRKRLEALKSLFPRRKATRFSRKTRPPSPALNPGLGLAGRLYFFLRNIESSAPSGFG